MLYWQKKGKKKAGFKFNPPNLNNHHLITGIPATKKTPLEK